MAFVFRDSERIYIRGSIRIVGALEIQKSNAVAKAEFSQKNQLLSATFEVLSPVQFYDILFGSEKEEFLYIVENETYKTVDTIMRLIEIAAFRSDIYMPPATFFRGCYKLATLKQLFAFVVDIDYLEPEVLELLIRTKLERGKLRPTAIMNSGQGVHLYFVLDEPIDCYNYRKIYLKKLLKALQKQFDTTLCKVDSGVTLIQPYRVVGSRNKFGQLTMAYRCGGNFEIKKLAKILKVELWGKGSKRQKTLSPLKSQKIEVLPNADRPFYEHTLSRIPEETKPGNRYTALFALAIIAYKCRIKKENALADLKLCQRVFNLVARKHGSRPVSDAELEKAFKGYSKDFVLVSSSQLEEWLGFSFPRLTKRNGRKRAEHLKMINEIRQARTSRRKEEQIKVLVNQGMSRKEIAEELGISLSSTYKTYAHCFSSKEDKPYDERLDIIKQYQGQGKKAKEIMKILGVSKPTLSKLLKKIKG